MIVGPVLEALHAMHVATFYGPADVFLPISEVWRG
jgi:hypothetical protein